MHFKVKIFILISFISSNLYSNKIIRVIKKGKYIKIDKGLKDGITINTKVCLYKKEKKIACGYILKIKKSTSTIIFKKKARRRLLKRKISKNFKKFTYVIKRKKEIVGLNKLILGWSPTLSSLSQAKTNYILYNGSENQDSIWIKSPSSGLFSLSFFIEYDASPIDLPLFSLDLIIGVQYLKYIESNIETQYLSQFTYLFVENKNSGSEIKFHLAHKLFQMSSLILAAGISITSAAKSISAKKKSNNSLFPNSEEILIAEAKSDSIIISMYLPFKYRLLLTSAFGLNMGLDLSIPLVDLEKKVSISSIDLNDPNKSSNTSMDEDLKNNFQQEKNSFSLSIHLGLYFNL